jgi:predicted aspartyl protease
VQGWEGLNSLTVLDQRGQAQEIQAVIDTGFNGYLTLPDTAINALGLSYHSRTIVTRRSLLQSIGLK